MKICPHCKKENAEDARFCAYCASPFDESPAIAASEETADFRQDEGALEQNPIRQAETVWEKTGRMSAEGSKTDSASSLNEQGMKIGFIQPKIIQNPGLEEIKQEPKADSTQSASSGSGSDRPPRFDPKRLPSHGDLPAGPDQPAREQNRPLILAVAVLALAALILAGILVYQNVYLPSHTADASEGMQPMEEVSDWDFYDEEESETASSERTPIHFSSRDSEVQRQKERLSSANFFEDDREEDEQSLDSSQTDTEDGTAYVSRYVMKVRDEPSLEGGQIDRIADNETVYIDRTKTASDDSLWGHLSNGKGWVCIQDSEQEYLTKKEAE